MDCMMIKSKQNEKMVLSPKQSFCKEFIEIPAKDKWQDGDLIGTKREDGTWEIAGQGNHRVNIQSRYPSTTQSGRFALLG